MPCPQPERAGNLRVQSSMYFFKNLFLYSEARSIQIKYIVLITNEGSTEIVIHDHRGKGSCAGMRQYVRQ